jgi:type II secretory pathway component GspD/PulD (secretin)
MEARDSLPDVLLGYVHADPGRNALTVAGPRSLVEKVRRDVAVLDTPPTMVEVMATAVEFERRSDLTALIGGVLAWPGGVLDIAPGTGDVSYGSVAMSGSQVEASLAALAAQDKAHLRSATRSTVLNGRTARLFVGQERRLATQYYDFWSDAFEARIVTLKVGTVLEVTPRASGGGTVTADVRSEVSNISETDATTGNPTVSQRVAETTVRLNEGETLYIGGLDLDQDSDTRRSALLGLGSYPSASARSASVLGVFVSARRVGASDSARVRDGDGAPGPKQPAREHTR